MDFKGPVGIKLFVGDKEIKPFDNIQFNVKGDEQVFYHDLRALLPKDFKLTDEANLKPLAWNGSRFVYVLDADGPEYICESCAGRDYTPAGVFNFDGNAYCSRCEQEISNQYCRGHDLYYENSCPYCDKLKGE